MASDIIGGSLGKLNLEYQGWVFADYFNRAKVALDEDSLRKYGKANGLDLENELLPDVVSSLKVAGLLSSSSDSLLHDMVSLRYKTSHAKWEEIEIKSIKSAIAFITELTKSRFENNIVTT